MKQISAYALLILVVALTGTQLVPDVQATGTEEKPAMTPNVESEEGGAILDGLTHRGNWISYMGALVSCARYLDPDVSVAWLWGSTGYAFSLTVHEALCPSGPYMPVDKIDHLLGNTGFDLETLRIEANEAGFAERIEELFSRTRVAIDSGAPVMGWSLDSIDWYPVHGYDGEGNYLFLRHNGHLGTYPHGKLGEKAPGGLALLNIVHKGSPPDDAAVVRDALSFAAKMGRGGFTEEAYTSGLGGYDAWIAALAQPEDPPDDGTVFGHAFNAACWYECRRQAVAFLEEAKQRLSDSSLPGPFDKAITHYTVVADRFKTLTELFPCQPGKMAPMRERFRNAELREKAIAALTAARTAEAEGLESLPEIERALASGTAGSGNRTSR
jgi:hypothetical protein